MSSNKTVTRISAGTYSSAALKSDGTFWVWGRDRGLDGESVGKPLGLNFSTPSKVKGLGIVTSVVFNEEYVVVQTNDGAIWTWVVFEAPIYADPRINPLVQIPFTRRFTILTGGPTECVLLAEDGTLWQWYPKYLRCTFQRKGHPLQMEAWKWQPKYLRGSSSKIIGLRITQIEAPGGIVTVSQTSHHSLAIVGEDREVWGWGQNECGQLGYEAKDSLSGMVKVSGLSHVHHVSAGTLHSLAVTADGLVWAWGDNRWGELGDGSTESRHTPVRVANMEGVAEVAAGLCHSVALKQDGTLWSWGRNAIGQLGDGTTIDRYGPVQVANLTEITAIAAVEHNLALKRDGTVWGWGANRNGQLGDGTREDRLVPVQVVGLD